MAKQQDLAGSPGKDPNSEEFVVASPAAFYLQNGLTAVSNNTAIIPRDSAGNIIITENSIDNPLLIIEPTARQINKQSFLNTVQTRFQYFSFPAIVFATGSFEPAPINLDDILIDPVYSRYKPTESRRIQIATPSGILMDELVDGNPTQKINRYFINKEIKRSGANLRFRIKLQHRFDTPDSADIGTAFFYIGKTTTQDGSNRTYLGPFYNSNFENTQQQEAFVQLINDIIINSNEYCTLGQSNAFEPGLLATFRTIIDSIPPINSIILPISVTAGLKSILQDIPIIISEDFDTSQNNLIGTNNQIDILRPNLRSTLLTQIDTYLEQVQQASPGRIGQYGVQDLYIDVTIPNSSFKQGDVFGITAVCNINEEFKFHTINADTSYWSVTNADKVVDDWNNLLVSGSNAG
jgi:hypothetical protein